MAIQASQRLIKGMYGESIGSNLFGLRLNQSRPNLGDTQADKFINNAGWYNGKGEMLGWGDLTPYDVRTIYGDLLAGELFIIVPKRNSFGGPALTIEEMAEEAAYIIAPGQMYCVIGRGVDTRWKDMPVKHITPGRITTLLAE